MKLKTKIPSIYHSSFPELLDLEYPEEQIATCSNCTLCRSSKSPYINGKCCSYHPHLPNFMVGGILVDADKSLEIGKTRVLSQIKNRFGITPYGIIPSKTYTKQGKDLDGQEFWKRHTEALENQLCPYYDRGNCTVWKYRENLCVTHFCSSIGGKAGKSFWNQINKYLKMAEISLGQYAMLQLGWPPEKIKTEAVTTEDFSFEDEGGNIVNEKYSKLWGDWEGKEAEFYQRCFEIISQVDAATFKKITGLKREILEAAIWKSNRHFLENVLPEKLVFNPAVEVSNSEAGYLSLQLKDESTKIPAVILPLIRAFNGNRTTVEIFHHGYDILYNLSETVDELLEKRILIKA
jgi:hypothetical protein